MYNTSNLNELVFSDRLRDVLPPLNEEQLQKLEANIRELGRVTDPIQYWPHNGKKIVVDGMNRLEIVRKLREEGVEVEVKADSMAFDSMEDVEYWMLERQATRRNLSPRQLQEIWGKLYNLEKRNPLENLDKSSRPSSQIRNSEQNPGKTEQKTAERIAKQADVAEATIRRAGKRQDQIDGLPENIRGGLKDILRDSPQTHLDRFCKLETSDQQKIAREIRTNNLVNLKDGFKAAKIPIKKPKAVPKEFGGGSKRGSGQVQINVSNLVDEIIKKHLRECSKLMSRIGQITGQDGEYWLKAHGAFCDATDALKEMRLGKA